MTRPMTWQERRDEEKRDGLEDIAAANARARVDFPEVCGPREPWSHGELARLQGQDGESRWR